MHWYLRENTIRHKLALQDAYQEARCWFGAGISQQMQAEHEAALQSLKTAEILSVEQLSLPDGSIQSAFSQDSQRSASEGQSLVPSGAEQNNKPPTEWEAKSTGARSLAVKAALARASVLKQLQRTDEANECMQTARRLDPAVGKYIKSESPKPPH